MADIKSMSHDDLIEHAEELQQTIDDHNDELQGREEDGYNKAMLNIESKIQHAHHDGFCRGFSEVTDAGKLKAYLNYKMEQRL